MCMRGASVLLVLFVCGFWASAVLANESLLVKTDFLELHTGAGRGFPVVNVVEKGETFSAIKRKTDWIKVKTTRGDSGWVSYKDFLAATRLQRSNFRERAAHSKWQVGINSGLLDSDAMYSAFVGFYAKPQVGVNVEAGKVAGLHSGSTFLGGNIKFAFLRTSVLSPVVNLGIGALRYSPRSTLINADQTQYAFFKYGIGALYVPYKRLGLELSLSNTSIADLQSYWGGSIAVSAFFN